MKKVLVFGAGGQLGGFLLRRYTSDTEIVWSGYTREELDITDFSQIEDVLDKEKPFAVVNAAAYTNVDKAETEKQLAWDVNVKAPSFIAKACSVRGVVLVHISTDYVFNGENGGTAKKPYGTKDEVNPIGVYGKSKEAGERAVMEAMSETGSCYILRTGWLYDNKGSNFFTTMARIGSERSAVKVVYDQRGTPTYVGSFSEAIRSLLVSGSKIDSGILHFSDEGVTCWASFAREIFAQLNMDVDVEGITSEEYPSKTKRPSNSHLDGSPLRELLNLTKITWQKALEMCINSEYVNVKERAKVWTQEPYDLQTRQMVKEWLIHDEENLLMEAFHKDIEFGTGGMRGICGPGTNRINASVIASSTQGLVNYIHGVTQKSSEPLKVAIAYDCRNQSAELAEVTARVLAGNGIQALLYAELRSTPQLSYTVRALGCVAGIVITASHNPPEYNGYKVYWSDGGQIIAPHDSGIISEVRKVKSLLEVKMSKGPITSENRITMLGPEQDEGYLNAVLELRRSTSLEKNGSDLCLVYTGLHGTGSVSVPPALKLFGFSNVHEVMSQKESDGNFPTVSSPNPEEGQALAEAIFLGEKVGASLVMGTDPDADRVGLAVPNGQGGFQLLNGNETGALLFDYVLRCGGDKGTPFGSKEFVASTIVTSPLLGEIGKGYGLGVRTTLTGFKHIAAAIAQERGSRNFVVGAEESYGYLIKDTARDKDAVSACCVMSELAHTLQEQETTMLERLEEIHRRFGLYQEGLISIVKSGRDGAKEISDMITSFRTNPPETLAGDKVIEFSDFASSEGTKYNLPKSNVLQFVTEKGSIVTVRPSGTEPKIKFYVSVKGNLTSGDDYQEAKEELKTRVKNLFEAFRAN